MSSPNEPGNGSVPPWQRGGRPQQQPPSRRQEPAGAHAAPGVEDRINRFAAGAPAASQSPSQSPEPDPPPARTDALRSELPDLSGPSPRPSRPKPFVRSRLDVGSRPNGPVRASMQIRRVDPWSVLKVSLVLSVALFFVWMIAVAFLYLVLGAMGVWSKLNSNVGDLLNNTTTSELVSSGSIFGGAALVGLVNIVLLTAMATVGAFIYNLTTDLVGGVEVTLADRD